jgi:Ca-activated chloride channel family protein
MWLTWLLLGCVASTSVVAAEQPKDALLILDASGSMWGQIDGVNKIVIAKDVVEELLLGFPESQRIGLVAYGHRKKGDCGDIETLAEVGASRADVIAKLRALSPKGKTPLSASVEHAANTLNYRKNAASVILVSDGLETCDVDPCALARTLEENGLDFTVHVVGFDVTTRERKGLQCIAQETGGEFLTADTAAELTQALQSVTSLAGVESTQAVGNPAPAKVALKATILANGPHIQSGLDWQIANEAGAEVFSLENAGYADAELPPGDYVARAVWHGWRDGTARTGQVSFKLNPQQPKVVTVPIDLDLPLELVVPATTAEGIAFDVSWTGPDDLGAYIYVTELDDSPRDYIYGTGAAKARAAYTRSVPDVAALDTNGDGKVDHSDMARTSIGGPSIAGEYEVRYVLDQPRLILARKPLLVTDTVYSVSAPETAAVSSTIDVTWQGVDTGGDFVTIIEAGSPTVFANGWTAKLHPDKPSQLRVPAEPGDYEIRYILTNGYTLRSGMQAVVQASVPIKVTDVVASLRAPARAVGGSTIVVEVTKPEGWEDDLISVIPQGQDKWNRDSWDRLFHRGQPRDPVTVQVPNIPGEYEVAYFLEPGRRILARQPISISLAEATVDAPAEVKAGSSFSASYTGPAYKGDRVVVVSADRPDISMWGVTLRYGFAATEPAGEGMISEYPISAGPGEYEIRYVTGLQHQVLARDRFRVVE